MERLSPRIAAGVAIAIAMAIGIAASAAEEQSEGEQAGSDRYSELVKEKGEFRETWVLPGVDPSRYKKVFIWDGQFEYRDVGPARRTRSTMLYTHKREFGISEEDRRKFEEIVGEAFTKEIARGKEFELINSVDDVDSSTLILRGGLFDIISRVPPEMVGRADVYLASIGEATFVLELMDAGTGDVIALVAERRAIETMNARTGSISVPANSATIIGDIRRWAGNLGRRLRSALDKAIKEGAAA